MNPNLKYPCVDEDCIFNIDGNDCSHENPELVDFMVGSVCLTAEYSKRITQPVVEISIRGQKE